MNKGTTHKAADGSTSYPDPKKSGQKPRILFICLGNICRSPAAEGVMKRILAEKGEQGWTVDSAGIGNWHIGQLPDRRMRVHAMQRGLQLDHRCRQITAQDFDRFDLIVGMDSMNISDLHELAPSPEAEKKIVSMGQFLDPASHYDHVPDPYYEGSEGFELVLDLLEDGCRRLYESVSQNRMK